MELVCISCPVGCRLMVYEDENGKIIVLGNQCKRGKDYAYDEYRDPKRMVTTSVPVSGGNHQMVSVKTSKPVKKDQIHTILNDLKKIKVDAPVKIGDIIMKLYEGSDNNIVATRNVEIR